MADDDLLLRCGRCGCFVKSVAGVDEGGAETLYWRCRRCGVSGREGY